MNTVFPLMRLYDKSGMPTNESVYNDYTTKLVLCVMTYEFEGGMISCVML